MPGDFLFWCKILALRALLGWLGSVSAPLEGVFNNSLQAQPADQTVESSHAPLAQERAEHASYAEVRAGNPGPGKVALTVDLGPWADGKIAEGILEALDEGGVKATLFFSGKFVEAHSDIVAKAAAAGHQLANHTYSHPDLTKLSRKAIVKELEKTQSLLEDAAGGTITKRYFRPPYGASNAAVLEAAKSVGFRSVLWTVEALDWQKGATVEKVVHRVLKKSKGGAIILMHITKVTEESLPLILKGLRGEGFEFASMEEVME